MFEKSRKPKNFNTGNFEVGILTEEAEVISSLNRFVLTGQG